MLANDYLILKEGKIGNVETLSAGAMARRWKMQKYAMPLKDDITMLRCSRSSVVAVNRHNVLQKASEVQVLV